MTGIYAFGPIGFLPLNPMTPFPLVVDLGARPVIEKPQRSTSYETDSSDSTETAGYVPNRFTAPITECLKRGTTSGRTSLPRSFFISNKQLREGGYPFSKRSGFFGRIR